MATESTTSAHAQRVLKGGGRGGADDMPARRANGGVIAGSWERCLSNYRLDPVAPPETRVLEACELREHRQRIEYLTRVAEPEMEQLYQRIAGSGYSIILSDAQGILLHQISDPGTERGLTDAGLHVGADWSEQREGTNGIGTCIIESRPLTVHFEDHFHAEHAALTCSASPIYDPRGGVLAVLDSSSVNREHAGNHQHTQALVTLTAQMIESLYFLREHRRDWILRLHRGAHLVSQPCDAMLALSADCRVIGANQEAARLLGCRDREQLIGSDANELFDLRQLLVSGAHDHAGYSVQQLRHKRSGEQFFGVMIIPQRSPAGATRRVERSAGGESPTRSGGKLQLLSQQAPDSGLSLARLCSDDPVLKNQALRAQRVVDSNLSILIQGETGTGKEAFARALHMASERRDKPFVALNCAAIPEALIESELFGYRHGAFTGARREGMQGKLVQSSGGTLFLDEIGDMPLPLQTRLLRVLEERVVQPLGSNEDIAIDLHVLSASHRDLREAIASGEFREDLYYRLAGFGIELPAFRERADRGRVIDGILAGEAAQIGHPLRVSDAAMGALLNCRWPGNVRQLGNTLRAAAALCDGGVIELRDLPVALLGELAPPAATDAEAVARPSGEAAQDGFNALEQAERETLLRELESNHWNITNTAARLGMSRNTIYRKLKKFGIPTTRG